MSERILEVVGLRVARAGSEVVADFNLQLSAGEVVALLGPNGAGKSTVVDAISGFAEKRGGTVRFGGVEVTNHPPHKLARRGLIQVSQDRDLFPDMTVRDNLELGAEALRGRRSEEFPIEKILDIFPVLRERSSQRAGSLSGGEQQMLAIGRALAGAPRLLLLDEPSTGLAPVVVDQMGLLLRKLTGTGLTLVLVEQNVGIALDLCDRFVVLKRGRIVFDGLRSELGDAPREFLAKLYM